MTYHCGYFILRYYIPHDHYLGEESELFTLGAVGGGFCGVCLVGIGGGSISSNEAECGTIDKSPKRPPGGADADELRFFNGIGGAACCRVATCSLSVILLCFMLITMLLGSMLLLLLLGRSTYWFGIALLPYSGDDDNNGIVVVVADCDVDIAIGDADNPLFTEELFRLFPGEMSAAILLPCDDVDRLSGELTEEFMLLGVGVIGEVTLYWNISADSCLLVGVDSGLSSVIVLVLVEDADIDIPCLNV